MGRADETNSKIYRILQDDGHSQVGESSIPIWGKKIIHTRISGKCVAGNLYG